MPKTLPSRPANGRLTALLKLGFGATEGGCGRSSTVECGSGLRLAQTEPWSTKCAPDGFRELVARFPRGYARPAQP